MIAGEGLVDPNDYCHGYQVQSDEIRVLLKKVNPKESYHPKYKVPMEVGSWVVIPKSAILMII